MNETKPMKAFVMVGAPASGKSTYAGELALSENANIICGDAVREELYGDASIQGNWVEIHDRIEELVSECCGIPIVLDGTHYLASYRKEAISLLRSYGYTHITAVVCNPSLQTCLTQNRQRNRQVPDHIIKGIHEKLQSSLKFIAIEGFNEVIYA